MAATCDEGQPLLQPTDQEEAGLPRSEFASNKTSRWLVYLLFVIVAGLDSTIFMLNLPLTRVYESIACYHYFAQREPRRFLSPFEIPENLCKAGPVQEELALVKGYELLFMALPGLFLAIPYGQLADRWGRRPVLRLCVLGLALAMTAVLLVCRFWWLVPLRFVWLGWSLTVIGGGAAVLTSIVFVILADSVPQDQRAAKFLQLSVAIFASQAISTPLAAYTMSNFGNLVPIAAGYALGVCSVTMTFLVPETLPKGSLLDSEYHVTSATNGDISTQDNICASKRLWLANTASVAASQMKGLAFLIRSRSLSALLVALLFDSFAGGVPYFIVQYTSTKFAAPISKAGFLVTIKAIVTMIVFLTLVPVIGRHLLQDKLGLDSHRRDLWLARITIICGPIGFIIIVVAPNFVIAGVGLIFTAIASGCVSMIRSVATEMIKPDQVSRLYGAINALQTIGGLVSGPVLAELFATGLRMGGGWIALPFGLCAILSVLSSGIVWVVRLPHVQTRISEQ